MKFYFFTLALLTTIGLHAQGSRQLVLSFDYLFAANDPVAFGTSEHLNADGATIKFDYAGYYLSNIQLQTSNGSVNIDTVLRITANTPNISLGQIPVGNYQSITYTIGVDSATNHADPTVYATGHPLALQVPSMHWSWNSGYIFARIEGAIDTSANQSAGFTVPFEYHLGGDNYKANVTANLLENVTDSTESLNVSISLALALVIDSFDVRNANDVVTHTMDNVPLARELVANLQASWLVDSYVVDRLTSVTELGKGESISLFPNPLASSTTITASFGAKQVEVYDVSGKLLFTQQLENGKTTINRSQFPSAGVYFIKTYDKTTSIKQLVVQ
jgi:hypothetical protein